MLTGSELGAAIEAARIKKNVSKKAFGDAFGIKPPSVQGWVKTGRIDKSKLIEVIRYFSDVVGPEHWGLGSDDADLLNLESVAEAASAPAESAADAVLKMLAKHGKGLPDEARQMIISAAKETPAPSSSNVISHDFSGLRARPEEILIPQYDVRGAMGHGQVPADYNEAIRNLVIREDVLREKGVTYTSPEALAMITGWGQSMEGTINDKDPVIVDRGVNEFIGEGVYVLTWHGLLYIKRVQQKDAEHFWLISDNPNNKDLEARIDDVTIHAKVLLVWNARKV
ncbi:S24 family peptidase [Stutzerimonas nitrititolerans]|uniref:S24 family peptidase n=1 Tax=Stutzerimonas nitrititolerans TaxID=2482751 RepID=A0AA42BE79_9GAMM|nr:S24 family peptidase [Stutzerimonas nitrititolerans]MCO7546147.1 S24 family peptidase [Stutzerimonas nitrititolerans]